VDSFIELLTNDGILVQIFTQYSVKVLFHQNKLTMFGAHCSVNPSIS